MNKFKFRVSYTNFDVEFVEVEARSQNAAFGKALKKAQEPLGDGTCRVIDIIMHFDHQIAS